MRPTHFFKHLLLFPLVIAGIGAIVMLLWNWLIPDIFGWSAINYWQALGLLALIRVLFGGFGEQWMQMGMMRHHHNPLREKWQKMTPEEQMNFVKKRHFHHGFGHDFFQYNQSEKEKHDDESETK